MRKYSINSPQVISEDLGGETVIINLESGSYYNMGEDAAKLWSPLIGGIDLNILKSKIQPAKPCKKAELESLIEKFFSKLIAEGLIKETQEIQSILVSDMIVDVTNLSLDVYTDMKDLLGLDPIHEVDSEAGWPVQKQ